MNEDKFDMMESLFQQAESGKRIPKPPINKSLVDETTDKKEEVQPIIEETEEEMAKKMKLAVGNFVEIIITDGGYNLLKSYLSISNGYNSIVYGNAISNQQLIGKITEVIGSERDAEREQLILTVETIVTPKNDKYPKNVMTIKINERSVTKKFLRPVPDFDVSIINAIMECEEFGKIFQLEQRKKELETKRKAEEEKRKAEEEKIAKEKVLAIYTDKIKEMAEFFHPDCWSFDELSGSEHTPSNGYKYRLTIKFPEFTITNSKKSSHLIKDMYIALHFNDTFTLCPTMMGRRGIFTLEEWQSNYGHSHMSVGNHGWASMCVGSETPLSEALSETSIKRKWDEDGVRRVLALLHGYINWESLEGTPYINMTTISRKNTTLPIASEITINQTYNFFITKLKDETIRKNINLKLTNVNNFSRFIFNRDEIEKALIPYVEASYIIYKSTDGTYMNPGTNIDRMLRDIETINNTNKSNWNESKLIRWKGALITPIVVLNYNGMDNLIKVPTPNLTESIYRMLEAEINNYNLKNKKYELG